MNWFLHQLPSIIITIWTWAGSLMLGDKKRIGWLMGIVSEVMWVCYAFWTHSYGFLLGVVFFVALYYRNWKKWRTVLTSGPESATVVS